MSDRATELAVIAITLSHVLLYAMAWWWAARSRHIGFLVLIVPAAVAWSLAGYRLVLVLSYGTSPFGQPKGGLQTVGYVSLVTGFGAFFVCALGILLTMAYILWIKRGR